MDIKSKKLKNKDEKEIINNVEQTEKENKRDISTEVYKDGVNTVLGNKISIKRLSLLMIIFICVAYIISTIGGVLNHPYLLKKDGFYLSQEFQYSINDIFRQIGAQTDYYKSEDYIKNGISNTDLNRAIDEDNRNIIQEQKDLINRLQSELDYNKKSSSSYEDKTSTSTTENFDEKLEVPQDVATLNDRLTKEKEYLNQLLSNQRERVKESLVNNKINGYNATKRKLERDYANMSYLAINEKENIVNTNVEVDQNDKEATFRAIKGLFIKYSEGGFLQVFMNGEDHTNKKLGEEIRSQFYSASNEFDFYNNLIYVSIPDNLQKTDVLSINYRNFLTSYKNVMIQLGILVAAIILLGLSYRSLRKTKISRLEEIYINKLDSIYLELRVGIVLIIYIISKSAGYNYNYRYYANGSVGYSYGLSMISILWSTGVCTIAVAAGYLVLKSIMRNKTMKSLKERSLVFKLYDSFNETYKSSSNRKKAMTTFAILTGVEALGLFLICGVFDGDGFTILVVTLMCVIFLNLITFLIINKRLAYLGTIVESTKNAINGNLNFDIPIRGRDSLSDLAYNINNMRAGLKKSIRNEMKSEQTKAELITNVSHDLKTPLTSIINYVDLLKKEEISPDVAKDYVEILDRKSQRLKVLIEDLFEVSKAASGTIELNIEKVDINSLLRQSLAEMNDKIELTNLDFKCNIPSEKIYVLADGKRMWRIFENLISNIIKYSLGGTRVYVDVREEDGKVEIQFKNISAYELNFDASELTERFKRGDESRHTEGSGLGLAIASSLTSLQGGTFDIEIDGDLFKVTVAFDITQ